MYILYNIDTKEILAAANTIQAFIKILKELRPWELVNIKTRQHYVVQYGLTQTYLNSDIFRIYKDNILINRFCSINIL